MRLYFDTEFTGFDADAVLLSIGIVAESGLEYYVELIPTGPVSDFVTAHVLPLFTGPVIARPNFAPHLAGWLAQFSEPILVSDSEWDLSFVRRALGLPGVHHPGMLRLAAPGGPIDVGLITLPGLGDEAQLIYADALAAHFAADPRQHHALVDARAMAAAIAAIETTARR